MKLAATLVLAALLVPAKAAGERLTITEHLRRGEALWITSCRSKPYFGLCAARRPLPPARAASAPARCLAITSRTIRVAREPTAASQAQQHFAEAWKLYQATRPNVEDDRAAAAKARFLLGDAALEEFLAVVLPQGLDFSTRNLLRANESRKQLGRYLASKGKRLAAARQIYDEVIKVGADPWALAAAARIGQLFHAFADDIAAAEIPKIPGLGASGAKRAALIRTYTDAYCGLLRHSISGLQDSARASFRSCVQRGVPLKVSSVWSKLCADALRVLPTSAPSR
jgi:hypothetical protein